MICDAHDYAYYECEYADDLITVWKLLNDRRLPLLGFPRQIIGGLKDTEMLQL